MLIDELLTRYRIIIMEKDNFVKNSQMTLFERVVCVIAYIMNLIYACHYLELEHRKSILRLTTFAYDLVKFH